MVTLSEELNTICQQAMQLLGQEKMYTQATVIGKLENLGYHSSRPLFSQIITGKGAGIRKLSSIAEGLQAILKKELGMELREGKFVKTAGGDFVAEIVPTTKELEEKKGLALYETGRVKIADKVAFFGDAEHEVIEFGATLRKFAANLCSGSPNEFRLPIEKLLQKGVNFKCYILEPESNFGMQYFSDRAAFFPDEADFEHTIKSSIKRLQQVQKEFGEMGYDGSLQLFSYRHIPYNYFMIVDPGKPSSKIMASHYMYGISRGDTPTISFSKANQPVLYQTYMKSFFALTKNAKKIIPPHL